MNTVTPGFHTFVNLSPTLVGGGAGSADVIPAKARGTYAKADWLTAFKARHIYIEKYSIEFNVTGAAVAPVDQFLMMELQLDGNVRVRSTLGSVDGANAFNGVALPVTRGSAYTQMVNIEPIEIARFEEPQLLRTMAFSFFVSSRTAHTSSDLVEIKNVQLWLCIRE